MITTAESFIFSIAESLIAKLASRAFQEASEALDVYNHLREFEKTLSLVKEAVLLDAEQNGPNNLYMVVNVAEWRLRQLKSVFYDTEDVFDEFECQTLGKQVLKVHGTIKDEVSHFFSSSNPLVFHSKMAQKIKDVSKRLDKVAADRHKFGLGIIDVDTRVVHRRDMSRMTHSRVSDSDVIGREHDKEKIIELLMQQNPNDDDKSLSVIPIVGMGGLGKTTLAKFVFNDKRIDECFSLKMWVCVSDDFDINQLIVKIINSANDANASLRQQNLNMVDLEQLQNQLRNILAGQKFLLVLDDVWNDDRVKWSLPPVNSLSLFVKWAFKEGEEEKHPHLVNIGKEIVKKCRGVPLAVRTLGSLLFSKYEANEWEYVRDNEIWNLPQKKKDEILHALKLSYDFLPSHLRQCFALFSLYPKDHFFDSQKVAKLWGAIGVLASPRKNETPEDVVKQYLDELLSRSFLRDFIDTGTICQFKIHDLVHDLALFVAKDECLLVNSHIQNIPENIRHLSFVEYSCLGNSFTSKSVAVRTIMFPNGAEGSSVESLLNTFVLKFKLLRVLDLSDSTCKTSPHSIALPKELRKFICLRHLEITTKQPVLPYSEITNLISLAHLYFESSHNMKSIFGGVKFPALKTLYVELETLVVENCVNLVLELWKEHHEERNRKLKLKLLEFWDLPQLVALPQWLQDTANSLQTLIIKNCNNLEMLLEWLSTLTNLKSLLILDCAKRISLLDNIHHLTALEHLQISDCPKLCKKCHSHVGEFWSKISHIKHVFIKEPEKLEEEEDE
ncbi:hypothetical protein GLYMA_19G135700v4 [Glycine max]|uniref:NB-ARC domain-containing protein n=1 Tax=Glycine max TaxID=3847 RepID=K7MY85_SOYBN|nr:hypothetical protein GYH30_052973 [Glycine max]KRG95187.1 hypothetical protein GLYMA_19G135700v4 [Glycine max]